MDPPEALTTPPASFDQWLKYVMDVYVVDNNEDGFALVENAVNRLRHRCVRVGCSVWARRVLVRCRANSSIVAKCRPLHGLWRHRLVAALPSCW
jgi:hypothetical protein